MSEHHPSLRRAAGDLIAGRWVPTPGEAVQSRNPARPADVVWRGTPRLEHVGRAVEAARQAQSAWARWPRERRFAALLRYADVAEQREHELAKLICHETGKALWDAKAEAGLLASKVKITLETGPEGGLARVAGFETALTATRAGRCWFRPHGVMAVIAPFNFPAHLPNGHIVPALAMGNTVVLKPSDKAPAVGQFLAELWDEALKLEGAPEGVVNLVQGGADVASALTTHDGIDGILFTGSWPVGRRILEANLDRPGRIVALEMGGNNAAIIMPDADLRQAVIECVRCAFITTGQRCTGTRRLIVHESVAERCTEVIVRAASALVAGDPLDPGTFMGPLISDSARASVLDAQRRFIEMGARSWIEARPLPGEGWGIGPGVLGVDRFQRGDEGPGCDQEVFGPVLRVSTFASLDDALEQANATSFGLAGSIFTRDPAAAERFLAEARAGCLNVNTGTAGASSKLPFGGLGLSGNHRPAGSFSLDYCAYPVAGMLERGSAATLAAGMAFDDAWLGA